MAEKIFEQIEQTAGFYGAATYTELLSFCSNYEEVWEISQYIPITSVKNLRERIPFAVGVLPPVADVTGKLLDRSASVLAVEGQEPGASPEISTTADEGASYAPDVVPEKGIDANRHRAARQVLIQAFKELGIEYTLWQMQYVQAVAFAETGYGQWGGANKPEMIGSNNWGAIHCPGVQQGKGNPNCIPSGDVKSNGKGFKVEFKRYSSPLEGAKDVVKQVLGRGATGRAISAQLPVYHVSYAMRRESYYGGFCFDAVKQYGDRAAGVAGIRDPDRNEWFTACAVEAITIHAEKLKTDIGNMAAASGDPTTIPLGTYEDADKWWRAGAGKPQEGSVEGDTASGNWSNKGSEAAQNAAQEQGKAGGTPLNITAVGRQFQAAQRAQIMVTQQGLRKMAETPPLRLLVNPRTFGVKGEKISSDGNWSRTGPIVSHWGDGQDKISASGKVAAFLAVDANNANGPGLTRNSRIFSESYSNLQALYQLYRNNGGLYLTDPLTEGQTKNLSHIGSMYIYYDATLYIGSFDTFTISEADTAPFTLEYSFEFVVRAAFVLDRNDDAVDYGNQNIIQRRVE